jgi:hypothetical protein
MRKTILGVALIIVGGCTDKAKPHYADCLESAKINALEAALTYCGEAVRADPQSEFGKLAAVKIQGLQRQKAEREEQARAEAARKAAQDAADAKCTLWTTICTLGRFPDGSEQTTGIQRFQTKAECERIGVEMGNIPCDPCKCRD